MNVVCVFLANFVFVSYDMIRNLGTMWIARYHIWIHWIRCLPVLSFIQGCFTSQDIRYRLTSGTKEKSDRRENKRGSKRASFFSISFFCLLSRSDFCPALLLRLRGYIFIKTKPGTTYFWRWRCRSTPMFTHWGYFETQPGNSKRF